MTVFHAYMCSKMLWVSLLVLCSLKIINAANILAIFPAPSVSHQLFYRVYTKALHERGHNLTVVTPNPINDPNLKNYTEIDLSYLYEHYKKILDISASSGGNKNRLMEEVLFIVYAKIVSSVCHLSLSNPNLMDIYRKNEKFDLVVLEWGLITCFHPFEKLSDGKIIGISSFELGAISQLQLGSAWSPSVASDISLEYSDKMNFFQRLRSAIFYWNSIIFYILLRWHETGIARKYFGSDVESLIKIEQKAAVVFENSHVTMSYPRANNINVIPIGGPGLHLEGKILKPLPKDIKEFLDDAPDGVIYFSLGTNVKTNKISGNEEEILMESFSRIKQKVLWKWENEDLKVNLKNVKKGKWFPQVEVLAHPNIKAFVTQAGLQSIGEAMKYNVPMITMPFFADQNHNARKLELEGAALYFDFDHLEVEKFTQALNEIVYNKTYKENIKRLSALVNDQPVPPLKKAVWWTEYVIRHNGAPHLRSAAVTMPWYQYLMLDVLAFIFLTVFLTFYVFYKFLKTLCRLFGNKAKSKKD